MMKNMLISYTPVVAGGVIPFDCHMLIYDDGARILIDSRDFHRAFGCLLTIDSITCLKDFNAIKLN